MTAEAFGSTFPAEINTWDPLEVVTLTSSPLHAAILMSERPLVLMHVSRSSDVRRPHVRVMRPRYARPCCWRSRLSVVRGECIVEGKQKMGVVADRDQEGWLESVAGFEGDI